MSMRNAMISLATLVAMALYLAGCGGGIAVQGSQRAVGADATITVGGLAGGSRLVELHAHHLPPPERVQQGTRHYAMWFSKQGRPSALGSIMEYNPGSRYGYARATTGFTGAFRIIVTAERTNQPAEPSDVVIFTQQAN